MVEVVAVEGGLGEGKRELVDFMEIRIATGICPQRTGSLGAESNPLGPRRPDWDLEFFFSSSTVPPNISQITQGLRNSIDPNVENAFLI